MEILNLEYSRMIRELYIECFVNTQSPFYIEGVQTRIPFRDGLCYTSYLWDCLKKPKKISRNKALNLLWERKNVFIMWDIHSEERIFIPNYWKYPKESVLLLEVFDEEKLKDLPEDIYIFDDTFSWSVILTHETDRKGNPYCLYSIYNGHDEAMKTDEILREILEYFLQYKKNEMFYSRTLADAEKEYDVFTKRVYSLYQSDEYGFSNAIFAAIETPCEMVFTEENLIQLECVLVFGKDHFLKYLFELCFFWEIHPKEIVSLFFSKLDDIKASKEAHAKFDKMAYTGLLQQIALSPDRFPASVRTEIWEELKTRTPCDMGEMEAFLVLAKENKVKVPRKCQVLFLANIANANISTDGLLWWYPMSKKRERNAFRDALEGMKAKNTLQNYLNFCDTYENSLPLTEKSKKQLEEIEHAFFDSYFKEGVEEGVILSLQQAIVQLFNL